MRMPTLKVASAEFIDVSAFSTDHRQVVEKVVVEGSEC